MTGLQYCLLIQLNNQFLRLTDDFLPICPTESAYCILLHHIVVCICRDQHSHKCRTEIILIQAMLTLSIAMVISKENPM